MGGQCGNPASINGHSVAETDGKGSGFLAKISDITIFKTAGSKNVH